MNRLEEIRQDFGAAQRVVALPPEPGADDLAVLPRSDVAALLAVAEAAVGFADHVANEDHGEADGVCFGCGQAWPCFVERLAAALAPLTAPSEEENRG